MKLKKNWQRYLVMSIFDILFCLLMGVIFFILRGIYNIPFGAVFIIYIASVLSVSCEPFTASSKFYEKYCNRECEGCKMWHCEVAKSSTKHCAK